MGDRSQVESLAQVLLDSIGPRLSGSPGQMAANDWLSTMYESWGVPARQEQYGYAAAYAALIFVILLLWSLVSTRISRRVEDAI